ncbi:MAG: hypothetical protein N2447_02970 [Thermoanaerobaculum sp.]|nr:hypothetical protein [Thermoanaerobaculum sp.]
MVKAYQPAAGAKTPGLAGGTALLLPGFAAPNGSVVVFAGYAL